MSFQESVALGGVFGLVQALPGADLRGCCVALVTEESCGLPISAPTFTPVWGSPGTSDFLEPLLPARGLSATPWLFWKDGKTVTVALPASGSLITGPCSVHPAVWPWAGVAHLWLLAACLRIALNVSRGLWLGWPSMKRLVGKGAFHLPHLGVLGFALPGSGDRDGGWGELHESYSELLECLKPRKTQQLGTGAITLIVPLHDSLVASKY